jgi:hypothetical protein
VALLCQQDPGLLRHHGGLHRVSSARVLSGSRRLRRSPSVLLALLLCARLAR